MYINISSIGPFKPYLFVELMIWMYNLSDELKADKSSVALLSHSLFSYVELMIWMYNLSDKLRADKSSVALLSHSLFSYIFELELTKKKRTDVRWRFYVNLYTRKHLRKDVCVICILEYCKIFVTNQSPTEILRFKSIDWLKNVKKSI